ncbi:gamma-glutamyltransferase [Devosia sp. PTR5]|uniref:Gamma-glutamyltransferase n=1 Tax=Devosia oryzisoli TaxID=2774138 RepID=A0A927FUA2_9HYPH|nr:gamma-glutamyltransferase [Devosia oryzisoli]MBD8064794.1 gamma-glutamyltransferase [Devosia oryzisoli]
MDYASPEERERYIVDQGPKPLAKGRAVASTGNPIVTEVVLDVLREDGNAADAAIAGAMVQAVVEPHLTSHAGMVSCLFWDGTHATAHQLNGLGTLPHDLSPFRPINGVGGWAREGAPGPQAAIPGFMPALGALHDKFGTLSWERLCAPAIEWAERGHPVSSFEYGVNVFAAPFYSFFEEARAVFMPKGFLPPVGSLMRNPLLAETLRRVAQNGPEEFTSGQWAKDFVAAGNALGWPVRLDHLTANPPRWQQPERFAHRGHEVVTLSAPERQGAFCSLVLGVLEASGIQSMEPFGADYVFTMAHALRLAEQACGFLHDPLYFGPAGDVLMDAGYQRSLANLIAASRPKVDLTEHVRLTIGASRFAGSGWNSARTKAPVGSCEISVVDAQGNWIQMMNTVQSGGIPGMAVGGVAMMGSHEQTAMSAHFSTWRTPGARMRNILGNTFVLRDGQPWLALGTPGNVYATVAQMLVNILDFGMTPPAASDAPRMLPLEDDYGLTIENRLAPEAVLGLTALGLHLHPMPAWDWNMGSFQMCWRDQDGLTAAADFRRTGVAAAL